MSLNLPSFDSIGIRYKTPYRSDPENAKGEQRQRIGY